MQLSLSKGKQTNKIMPSQNDGVMIILSSPSGAGKTTLVNELSKLDNYEISISHTTREPRSNETRDEHYFFVQNEEFQRLITVSYTHLTLPTKRIV